MKIEAKLVKAFTQDESEGNPAGIIHDANGLDDEAMRKTAELLGFSESAFIQDSEKADFRVRFFAAKQEVDFCGHATVATFHALVEAGKIKVDSASTKLTQETKAGIFPVTCYEDGKIMMTQAQPEFGFVEQNRQRVAELLGIAVTNLLELPVQMVSTVSSKVLVGVQSLELLRSIQPDLGAITGYSKETSTWGIYAFALGETDTEFYARFFDPIIGIDEDAATGVAAGPFGCYVDRYITNGSQKQFTVHQGFDMGKNSTIHVDISDGIQVGGYAANFGQKTLEV
jgi:PhzF family phenazine biosynthesis protein